MEADRVRGFMDWYANNKKAEEILGLRSKADFSDLDSLCLPRSNAVLMRSRESLDGQPLDSGRRHNKLLSMNPTRGPLGLR